MNIIFHFQFMQIASRLNYFQTDILAWLDAGFYRDFVENGDFTPFTLMVPNHFISDRVSNKAVGICVVAFSVQLH